MANFQKLLKLQSPFEKIKQYSSNPVVNLYRAVIMQMIIDASNISKDRGLVKNALAANEFLFGKGEEFSNICDNAELSKSEVVKAARGLIAFHKRKSFLRNKIS